MEDLLNEIILEEGDSFESGRSSRPKKFEVKIENFEYRSTEIPFWEVCKIIKISNALLNQANSKTLERIEIRGTAKGTSQNLYKYAIGRAERVRDLIREYLFDVLKVGSNIEPEVRRNISKLLFGSLKTPKVISSQESESRGRDRKVTVKVFYR